MRHRRAWTCAAGFAPKVGHAEHGAASGNGLFLDTWPYNAHTTAADALWMGLPVLTMAGHSFAARVAASLLDAVGLPELITHSPQAYVQRAVALARDGAERDRLRAHLLRARDQAPLFDAALRAPRLEAAFRQMHERRCQGLPPAPLDVPPPDGRVMAPTPVAVIVGLSGAGLGAALPAQRGGGREPHAMALAGD